MANYQSTHTGSWHDDQLSCAEVFDLIYPVGSIYMSVNSTSPATLFGGTWEAIENTFLVAQGTNYIAGDTGGAINHTHTLNHTHTYSHTHTTPATTTGAHTLTVAELPKHQHIGLFWQVPDADNWNVTLDGGTCAYKLSWSGSGGSTTNGAGLGSERGFITGSTGNSSAHTHPQVTTTTNSQSTSTTSDASTATTSSTSNLPPYLAVYMWKRTA